MSMIKRKHVFAVCAYKESEYLEQCVKSLKRQTVQSEIIICTSTPNEHISKIAEKYDIPLYVRDGASDIRDDWNFAYNTADGDLVTIAHQDDLYGKNYVKYLYKKIEETRDPNFTMFLTDYMPIKHSEIGKKDINCRIRRFLRTPLKFNRLADKIWVKKACLALGNSIVCPSVTYNKAVLGENVFTSELKFNIDWDTFYKLACVDGRFLYVDRPLTFYRVHEGATSMEFIENNKRVIDDTIMFDKFWPHFLTKFIMKFYKFAYRTYL